MRSSMIILRGGSIWGRGFGPSSLVQATDKDKGEERNNEDGADRVRRTDRAQPQAVPAGEADDRSVDRVEDEVE